MTVSPLDADPPVGRHSQAEPLDADRLGRTPLYADPWMQNPHVGRPPSPVDRQTSVKTLLFPKLCLQAVKIVLVPY